MPSIKDISTVDRIAEVFCGEGKRNKTETLRIVGYKDSYCDYHGTTVVYSNSRVKQAIARIDAKHTAKSEWNREISLKQLYFVCESLKKQVENGNIAATNAYIRALTEFNAISSLHVTTNINKNQVVEPKQTEAEQRALAGPIRLYKDNMAKQKGA